MKGTQYYLADNKSPQGEWTKVYFLESCECPHATKTVSVEFTDSLQEKGIVLDGGQGCMSWYYKTGTETVEELVPWHDEATRAAKLAPIHKHYNDKLAELQDSKKHCSIDMMLYFALQQSGDLPKELDAPFCRIGECGTPQQPETTADIHDELLKLYHLYYGIRHSHHDAVQAVIATEDDYNSVDAWVHLHDNFIKGKQGYPDA